MFSIFKRKTKVEVLNKKYWKLISEAHRLSTVNRRASDQKVAEADRLAREIEVLRGA